MLSIPLEEIVLKTKEFSRTQLTDIGSVSTRYFTVSKGQYSFPRLSINQACFSRLQDFTSPSYPAECIVYLHNWYAHNCEAKDPLLICNKAYYDFLIGPDSPFINYKDQLFPDGPFLVNDEDIFSNTFRYEYGHIFPDAQVNTHLFVNFFKAIRMMGESPKFVERWYAFVKAGMPLRNALFFAFYTCQFSRKNNYLITYGQPHSFLDYRGYKTQFIKLCTAQPFTNSSGKISAGNYQYHGCDGIWRNDADYSTLPDRFNLPKNLLSMDDVLKLNKCLEMELLKNG